MVERLNDLISLQVEDLHELQQASIIVQRIVDHFFCEFILSPTGKVKYSYGTKMICFQLIVLRYHRKRRHVSYFAVDCFRESFVA